MKGTTIKCILKQKCFDFCGETLCYRSFNQVLKNTSPGCGLVLYYWVSCSQKSQRTQRYWLNFCFLLFYFHQF